MKRRAQRVNANELHNFRKGTKSSPNVCIAPWHFRSCTRILVNCCRNACSLQCCLPAVTCMSVAVNYITWHSTLFRWPAPSCQLGNGSQEATSCVAISRLVAGLVFSQKRLWEIADAVSTLPQLQPTTHDGSAPTSLSRIAGSGTTPGAGTMCFCRRMLFVSRRIRASVAFSFAMYLLTQLSIPNPVMIFPISALRRCKYLNHFDYRPCR